MTRSQKDCKALVTRAATTKANYFNISDPKAHHYASIVEDFINKAIEDQNRTVLSLATDWIEYHLFHEFLDVVLVCLSTLELIG